MEEVDQRAVLERLVQQREEDYANLSRLLGRNSAYVQQFIKRGIPRRLAEHDRRKLAAYLGVDDETLGGPRPDTRGKDAASRLRPIPRLAIHASAGSGSLGFDERPVSHVGFDPAWLRQLCGGVPENLSLISVQGDSMTPTLVDGEDIMVDRGDAASRLRDGIYVLRRDDTLMVKRLAVSPVTRKISVRSDNPAYPSWPDCRPGSIEIIGRVVWAARKVG